MRRKLIIALVVAVAVTVSGRGISTFAGETASETVDVKPSGDNNETSGDNNETQALTVSNIQPKKVIISRVSIDTLNIEPGKPFTLTYRVENISGKKIYGLSLKIVNVEGKSTLEGFMPVDTTNEIYVGSIGINDVRDVSITLCSDPNTKPGVYNFNTSVMYNLNKQPQEEITKISGIMIKSIPELEVTSVESMGMSVMGTLVNDGLSKVKKIYIKVNVNGEIYEQNISSIDSESEEYFEVPINPLEIEAEAKIEITYEDLSGGQYKTESSCIVYPMMIEEEGDSKSDKKVGFFGFIKRIFNFGV